MLLFPKLFFCFTSFYWQMKSRKKIQQKRAQGGYIFIQSLDVTPSEVRTLEVLYFGSNTFGIIQPSGHYTLGKFHLRDVTPSESFTFKMLHRRKLHLRDVSPSGCFTFGMFHFHDVLPSGWFTFRMVHLRDGSSSSASERQNSEGEASKGVTYRR